jgi:hypothetical protein
VVGGRLLPPGWLKISRAERSYAFGVDQEDRDRLIETAAMSDPSATVGGAAFVAQSVRRTFTPPSGARPVWKVAYVVAMTVFVVAGSLLLYKGVL